MTLGYLRRKKWEQAVKTATVISAFSQVTLKTSKFSGASARW